MKKIILAFILGMPFWGSSQTIQNINKTNGTSPSNNISTIDSIVFPAGGGQMQINLNNAAPVIHQLQDIVNVNFFIGGVYPAGTVFCSGSPTAVVDIVNPITGQIWMDRNLGANQMAINSTDTNSFGDLYQWGRGSDGHQCRNSQTTSTTSSADQPGHGHFILSIFSTSIWRVPANNNLWQGIIGVNNPCPSGYRLPTDSEFNAERQSWSSSNSAGAFASALKLPLAGYRGNQNGIVYNAIGQYWGSKFDNTQTRGQVLNFDNSNSNIASLNKSVGRSVRCIKHIPYLGTINTIDCDSVTNFGTLITATPANNTGSVVPYTGGNGGTYVGQIVSSTGVTGLTAMITSGYFSNGSGSLTYNISGTPLSSGTANFVLTIGGQSCTLSRNVSLPIGSINTLNCNIATNSGTLTQGTIATGFSSTIPYTGGNGGTFNPQNISSTGVTGLIAVLSAGSFANGDSSLTFSITGTPGSSGIATFALNVGGQSCSLNLSVNNYSGVFCTGSPTAIVDVTNPATGKIWMDRNLGATQASTSPADTNSFGDLYQWGRRSDGHQCRTSPSTNALSSSDQPSHGSFISVQSGFIFDWRSPQNSNLWQGVNGVNNPCPSAYRLPTEVEFDAERISWIYNDALGASMSPLRFPATTYRNNYSGLIVNNATIYPGLYWTSTVSNTFSVKLYFTSNGASMEPEPRGSGLAVRCIKN
jgi:hypothetical protein